MFDLRRGRRTTNTTQTVQGIPRNRHKRQLSTVWAQSALYGSGLLAIFVAALAVLATANRRPILFSYEAGLWTIANPKTTTILCTLIGTLTATCTLFFLDRLLVMASRQMISTRGMSMSLLDIVGRLFHHSYTIDLKRVHLSLLTIAFAVAAFYLGTAFTTLVTPTPILTSAPISGAELDFSSDGFWSWYNYLDADGNPNRTITGCHWVNHTNNGVTDRFPTCPYNSDQTNFLYAGFAAAQSNLTTAKPATNYLAKQFDGSTGGIFPVGWGGFQAFNNIQFTSPADSTYPAYNYSISQQGLSGEVSCLATTDSPITSTDRGSINETILGIAGGTMRMINFTWTCPNGQSSSSQIVTPHDSWATLVSCEQSAKPLKYILYLGAFGQYAAPEASSQVIFFPNMTCTLAPLLSETVVQYNSADELFHIENPSLIDGSGSKVPNETWIAPERIFSLATSNSGNMVIDSLHQLNLGNDSITLPMAMEQTIRGEIEFFGTSLRQYYTSEGPPGSRPITGNYTVWRVGYQGDTVVLVALLPLLIFILALAITYVVLAERAAHDISSNFSPVDTVSLVLASACGGRAGNLNADDLKGDGKLDKKSSLKTVIRYNFLQKSLETVHPGQQTEVGLSLAMPGKQSAVASEEVLLEDEAAVSLIPMRPSTALGSARSTQAVGEADLDGVVASQTHGHGSTGESSGPHLRSHGFL